MSTALAPDIETVAIQYLKAHTDVLDLVASTRIASELPAKVELPFVTVLLAGGIPSQGEWLEGVRLQFDVWGTNREETRLLARTVRAAVLDMLGSYDGCVVNGVATLIPLRKLHDPDVGRVRYQFDVRVWCHPGPDLGS